MVWSVAMVLASVFGVFLIAVLIIGDWYQFTNLRPFFARYGCGVATRHERIPQRSLKKLQQQFNKDGLLQLPHGIARLFAEEQLIVIRPYYQLFTMRFRTAWPLKGSIQFQTDAGRGPSIDIYQTYALVFSYFDRDLVRPCQSRNIDFL